MRLTTVTPPAEEPVSLADAKQHLRIEIGDDDALISALIVAARQRAETQIRRTFVTTTFDLTLDEWTWEPGIWTPTIQVPRPPLQSVTSITYVDTAGAPQTLAAPQYLVQLGTPGRIAPAYGVSWPTVRYQLGSIVVRFVAGYGAASAVPESIKLALKMLVGHWYEHREAAAEATVGGGVGEMPLGVDALLSTEDWGSYV